MDDRGVKEEGRDVRVVVVVERLAEGEGWRGAGEGEREGGKVQRRRAISRWCTRSLAPGRPS